MAQTEAKVARGAGMGYGALYGSAVGFGCIVMGIILCFTVIGAVIGIPLVIFGCICPILGALAGLTVGALKGACPWCGGEVTSTAGAKGVDCPACKKRIVIKGNAYVQA